MSRDLKPCPFCEKPLAVRAGVNPYGRCETPDCWTNERKITVPLDDPRQVDTWNTRGELSSLRGEGEGSDVIGRLVGTSMSEIAYQGRWELCIHFGQGDEAKGRMRAASDAIRQALASIPSTTIDSQQETAV